MPCLASPANFIYGRVEAKVLSHVTVMPVLLRPVNNFLGQVVGSASEGKYNRPTVNTSSSGEVTIGRGSKEDGEKSCIITRVKWENYWKSMMYLKNWEKRNLENDKIL